VGMHVVIMAGGTGGHIFPALAVADELKLQGVNITWLGAAGGMEAKLVPDRGYPVETMTIKGLRGNGAAGWLLAPFRVTKAVLQARTILKRLKPQVVVGLGGFVSGPGGLAAKLLGIPLVIHEQNAVAGMTNRWLAKIARAVFFAFPQAFAKHEGNPKFRFSGNPVRSDIVAIPPPEERFSERQGALKILVLGGSLGALVLNEVVPEALSTLSGGAPIVRHQAGRSTLEKAQSAYKKHSVTAEVTAFIDDMAAAYTWADVVICRAGALTVAELAAAGVGAILVPYPFAVDDHQTDNAKYLTEGGAGWLIPQPQFTVEQVAKLLEGLDRDILLKTAQKSRSLAITDAAAQVSNYCLKIGQA
jgi:UDP-N-acetylglucosamine--N-acetylmuramyl-(pentapeptide) pyrophosphoryl-undecaprenol N-acetylglucosamine transferase